jgi:hypothetical protein
MWKMTQQGVTITYTLNPTGVFEQSVDGEPIAQDSIWKADGNNIYIYYPQFGSGGSEDGYIVSGSTFTIPTRRTTFTKQ